MDGAGYHRPKEVKDKAIELGVLYFPLQPQSQLHIVIMESYE
jgi:hypothetical protein